MKVLFDNCIPAVHATSLHGFVQAFDPAEIHIKDMPGLPRGWHSADIEWIDLLRRDPDDWLFITGDGRLRKNSAKRSALRPEGLHVLVLAPAYQKTPPHMVPATIAMRGPDLLKIA